MIILKTENIIEVLNKMSDETKKEFDIVGTGQTMDEVKTELEEQGYNCK